MTTVAKEAAARWHKKFMAVIAEHMADDIDRIEEREDGSTEIFWKPERFWQDDSEEWGNQ